MSINRNGLLRTLCLILLLSMLSGCASRPAPEAAAIQLVLLNPYGVRREAIDGAIAAYRAQHPNVTVRVKGTNGQPLFVGKEVNPDLFAGVDVVLLPDWVLRRFDQAGVLRDLSSVKVPKLNAPAGQLYDDLSRIGGRRVVLPISISPTVLVLSSQAFQSAGVALPPQDWTVPEFEQVMADLLGRGARLDLPGDRMIEPMVRAYGGRIYDPVKQTYGFELPETRQGLAVLARLVNLKIVGAGTAASTGDAKSAAVTTAYDMVLAGLPSEIRPFPRGPAGRGVPASAILGAVLNTAAQPEVAMDFLLQMVAAPAGQIAFARSGYRPVTADEKALAAWRETVGESVAQTVDLSLQTAFASVGVPYADVVSGLAPYLTGAATLDQVLPALSAKLQ